MSRRPEPPCMHCGAPRVDGIRTCGGLCVRGVDPRLADYLGVMPWVLSSERLGVGTDLAYHSASTERTEE